MARLAAPFPLLPLLVFPFLSACTPIQAETLSRMAESIQVGSPYATLELEVVYPEGFGYLSGVRELSDGTLMAADPLAQLLLRLDMDAGTSDSIGQVGEGPGEFQQPDQVFPLPGDSTLLVDLGKGVLVVVGPDQQFHEGITMFRPSGDGRPDILTPRFVDESGSFYFEKSRPRQGGPRDSVAAARFDLSTETSDTVAPIWTPDPQANRRRRRSLGTILQPRDEWAVGPEPSQPNPRPPDPAQRA